MGNLFVGTSCCCRRVLENAHYVSDVVAAAGIGIIVGDLMTRRLLLLFAGHQGIPADPPMAQQPLAEQRDAKVQ